jgi:hypothetical protein
MVILLDWAQSQKLWEMKTGQMWQKPHPKPTIQNAQPEPTSQTHKLKPIHKTYIPNWAKCGKTRLANPKTNQIGKKLAKPISDYLKRGRENTEILHKAIAGLQGSGKHALGSKRQAGRQAHTRTAITGPTRDRW